jgi:phytoene dehydrogenase-like protein
MRQVWGKQHNIGMTIISMSLSLTAGLVSRSIIDYPIGGSGAIVQALVRDLQKWGGTLRLGTYVEQILVESGKAVGVRLRNGETLRAAIGRLARLYCGSGDHVSGGIWSAMAPCPRGKSCLDGTD